jgi:hypothetical protein
METALNRPISRNCAEGFTLEPGHFAFEELATLERREAKRSLAWPQPVRQASKGAAGPARTADQVKLAVHLPGDLRAAAQGIGVAAAFGQKVELPELAMQHRDNFRAHLLSVCCPVQVCQSHPMAHRIIQRWVKGKMFLPANHPDGCEAKRVPGRGGGADVVRISAAEREQSLMALLLRGSEVVLELAPFISGDIRVDQIITFEEQPQTRAGQSAVPQLLQRRRQPQRNRPGRCYDVAHATTLPRREPSEAAVSVPPKPHRAAPCTIRANEQPSSNRQPPGRRLRGARGSKRPRQGGCAARDLNPEPAD